MQQEPGTQRSHVLLAAAVAVILPWLAALLSSPAAAFCSRPAPGGIDPGLLGRGSSRTAVLTFDAAWSADGAGQILEVLDRMEVRATFFLAGRFISSHPRLVRRIAGAGHEVGNHTWRHDHLTMYARNGSRETLPGVTREGLLEEMEATASQFLAVTGRPLAPIWRAPFGETNREILGWTRRAGYTHVGWSPGMDTLDWVSDRASELYRSPEAAVGGILRRLARRPAGAGPAVILMHLGSTREPSERFSRALPALIDGIRAAGYRLVTAGEALPWEHLP